MQFKKKHSKYIRAGILLFSLSLVSTLYAQESFYGEIRLFAGVYCPKGWIDTDGRSLEIVNYQILYSLISNHYGGDGIQTFKVPDLRGRVALGQGQNTEGLNYRQGDTGGSESVVLTTDNLPVHTHGIKVSDEVGEESSSVVKGKDGKGAVTEQPIQSTGMSIPHENRQPFQVVRYCIANTGIYPERP